MQVQILPLYKLLSISRNLKIINLITKFLESVFPPLDKVSESYSGDKLQLRYIRCSGVYLLDKFI